MRSITLFDFLSEKEIQEAVKLQNRISVRDQIISPNMERINKALGQENDPDYLSYMVEYVMRATGHWLELP